jgi:predicted outer membrane repeat protein
MHCKSSIITLLIGFIITLALFRPAYAVDDVITTCDFASLQQAVHNVNTYGGIIRFDCTGTIIFPERLVIESDVIILGSSDIIFDGAGQSSFFFVETEGASLILDGLTLQNGVNSYGRSSAITNSRRAELIISNCIFLNNSRVDDYPNETYVISNSGTLTIRNSIFSGHSGENAVIQNGGSMTVTDSTFNDNRGGAIDSNDHYYGANVTIHNSTFTNNSAQSGGAIIGGDLTISDSVFIGNTAIEDGGAISRAGFVTITNSTFTNNSAESGGAISHSGFGTLDITDSTFDGNSAQHGGAIYLNRNTITVKNSVFSDNVATDGQSAIFSDGIVISENTQYENNTCGGYGVFTDNGGNIANNAEGCPPDAVMLQTVVTDCDHFEGIGTISQAVNIAKLTGMPVTFACSGTIMFPHGLYIQGDVSIIGGGDVIFDGGGEAGFFGVGQNYPEFPRPNEVFVESLLVLDGLTLQNGRAIDVNHNGTLIVNNSTFLNNTGLYGGAISNNNTLIVKNSTFIGNSASYHGGAINNNGRAVITESIFVDNSAPLGGAIHNYWWLSSQNSHYENNTCEGWLAIINDGGNTSDNADGCPREIPATTVVTDCENFKGAGTLFEAVYVANVTHEPITFTCSGTIVFTEPLIIQGNVTINGDNKIVFDGGEETQFFGVWGKDISFVLNDLIFQNGGYADDSNYSNSYGLINNDDATLHIRNVIFRENAGGFTIIGNSGHLIISNSTFSDNFAGIIIDNKEAGTLSISNSIFESLLSFTTIYNRGRATIRDSVFNNRMDEDIVNSNNDNMVLNNHGEMIVSGSSFSNNHTNDQSPIVNGNRMIITDSIFINNSTQNMGGVIHNSHWLIVANSIFADNSADACGVIMNYPSDHATILNSTFDNNVANQFGGAICNMGEMLVSDSTFSDNSAMRGGAIFNTGETGHPYNPVTQLTIANSEFINNMATEGNSIFNAHNAMLFTENIQCGDEECITQEILEDE